MNSSLLNFILITAIATATAAIPLDVSASSAAAASGAGGRAGPGGASHLKSSVRSRAKGFRANGMRANGSRANGMRASKAPQLALGLEYGSTLQPGDSYERISGTVATANAAYPMTESFSFGAGSAMTWEMSGEERRSVLGNTRLSLIHSPFRINPVFSAIPSIGVTAPTNKYSYGDDTFRGAVGGGGQLAISLAPYRLPLSAALGILYDRNIHKYSIGAAGRPNIRERLSETASATLRVARGFTITVAAGFVSEWTYRSFTRNRFSLSEDIRYAFTRNWRAWIGHSNSGDAFKADGMESNLRVFDEQASVIRVGAGYDY